MIEATSYFVDELEKVMKTHRWSGWPGAFCLDCGIEDQVEIALADGVYDPHENTWSDKKREIDCATAMRTCPPVQVKQ